MYEGVRGLVTAIIGLVVWAGGPALAGSPPPLSAYGALPKTEALDLSPNGTMFARISTEGEERLLIVAKISGEILMMGRVGTLKVAGLTWADDDHVVIYTHRTEQHGDGSGGQYSQEYGQAVVANVKTQKFSPLTGRGAGYVPAIFGHYGFVTGQGETSALVGLVPAAMPIGRDLVKVGLDSGKTERIAFGNRNNRDWAVDETGAVIAVSEYENRSGDWKIMPPESSKPIVTGHAAFGAALNGLGRSPGTVLVAEADTQEDRLQELRLSDGILSAISEESVEQLVHLRSGGPLAGMVMAGERWRTVLFNPVLARHMASIEHAFGDASVSVVAISANFSRIVVYADGGGTTGTYQMVDFETKTATPLADAYPSIPNSAVGAVEIVDYQAGDGLGIKGILTLPSSGVRSNLPLVVIPHGGPEAMDHAGFSWLAQAFASRGYAVFQPNFRGSSGHGVAFRNAGFGQWGRKMQTDISDGVAALAARGIVDAHRACIVGASYGGYAALAGVTLQHGLYRCAASFAGVSDPAALIRVWSFATSKNPAQRYWRSYLGVGEGNDRVPDEISPLAHAAEADAPVLLIHGKDDTTVGIYQSEQMEYALKRAGKTVEFVRLDGEDHYLSRSTTRLKMLEAMVAFVEKHNPAAP